jgi:hypothetical protein
MYGVRKVGKKRKEKKKENKKTNFENLDSLWNTLNRVGEDLQC